MMSDAQIGDGKGKGEHQSLQGIHTPDQRFSKYNLIRIHHVEWKHPKQEFSEILQPKMTLFLIPIVVHKKTLQFKLAP